MKGYQYQAYEAGAANIDPAAELGDGVTVAGVYSPLSKISDDGRGYAGISSPGEAEMEDEYPAGGYITQEFNRKIAETRSIITKTSKEIMLKVEGIDGKYTEVKTTLDGLTVTDASGTTKINGSSIETSTLKVSSANITGTLTIGQLPSGVAQTSQIPTKTSQLNNDSEYQTKQGVTTIINGTVTTDYIYALGVEASTLRGSTIALKDGDNHTIGGFTLADTTTSTGLGMTTTWGGIKIQPAGNIFLQAGTGGAITLQNNSIVLAGALCLGGSSYGPSAPSGTGAAGQLYVQLV